MILMNSELRVNIDTTCNQIKLGPCQTRARVVFHYVPFQEACGNVYVQIQAIRKFRQIQRTYTNFVFQLKYMYLVAQFDLCCCCHFGIAVQKTKWYEHWATLVQTRKEQQLNDVCHHIVAIPVSAGAAQRVTQWRSGRRDGHRQSNSYYQIPGSRIR